MNSMKKLWLGAGVAAGLLLGTVFVVAQSPVNLLTSILSTDLIRIERATTANIVYATPNVVSGYVRGQSLLYTTIATAGSTGTTAEQTLASYSLPAATLNTGTKLRIGASFTAAGNADTKTFKCYFGAASISSGALLTNGKNGDCHIIVTRFGAAVHMFNGKMLVDTTAITDAVTTDTTADTGAITIKFTATQGSAQANDVVLNDFFVERLGN